MDDKSLLLLCLFIVLMNTSTVRLGIIKAVVLFIAVCEILKLLLFGDLGGPKEHFFWQID